MSSFGIGGKASFKGGLDGVEATGLQHGTIKRRTDGDLASDMEVESGGSGLGPGALGSSHMGSSGSAANLSRKKAVPPQPAKKLVIKPFKGACPCLYLVDYSLRFCSYLCSIHEEGNFGFCCTS